MNDRVAKIIKQIIDGYPEEAEILDDVEMFAQLLRYLPIHINDHPGASFRIINYIVRLPVWCGIVLITRCMDFDSTMSKNGKNPGICDNKNFIDWTYKHRKLLLTI